MGGLPQRGIHPIFIYVIVRFVSMKLCITSLIWLLYSLPKQTDINLTFLLILSRRGLGIIFFPTIKVVGHERIKLINEMD